MSEKARLSVKKSEGKDKGPVSSISKTKLSQSADLNSLVEQTLYLQRTIGNQAVNRLIQSGAIQAKLKIGQPDDIYEKEADRVAEQVMRISEGSLARKEKGLVKAKANYDQSSDITSCVDSHINALKGKGSPLSPATRDYFEPRFGSDLSQVRLHISSDAAAIAKEINARAFTTGRDVFFGAGQYSPSTSGGKQLIAHELTHVVQQKGAPGIIRMYSTQNCEDQDLPLIEAGQQRALEMLDAAISRLSANPVTANTQTLFGYHFGAYADWRRSIVLWHFRRDRSLLQGDSVTYECESDCSSGTPSNTMYTWWVFGDVHVCVPWLRSSSLNSRGMRFIHEIHHWDGLRGHLDLGYHKNNQDNNTSWPIAVNNADAYSRLAQDLYEQP